MELLIIRHGKAEDIPSSGGGDFSRALVEKGREQARNAARILSAAEMLPELVLTSPLLRARQTAEIFTQAAGIPGPILQDWLSCGMSPAIALANLASYPEFRRIMIVGHEPDLSTLLRHALDSKGFFEVRKGSLTCLDLPAGSARAVLRFHFPFKLGKHFD